jgi:hypothetical protein
VLARTARVAPVRLRRGEVQRCQILRATSDTSETIEPEAAVAPPPRAALDAAIGEHRARALAAQRAEHELPRAVRVRPPWWAFWAVIVRWLAGLLKRREVAAWHQLVAARDEARVTVERAEGERAALEARAIAALERFPARVRELAADPEVEALALAVTGGPLPEGIELVELDELEPERAGIDVVVDVAQRAVHVREPDGNLRRVGAVAEIGPQLGELARRGRALRLGWRAVEALRSIEATLAETLARSEAGYRSRIAELDRLHVDDRDGLITERLAAIRPQLIAQTGMIVKQLLAQVGGELDRLDTAWADSITAAATVEQLQAAITAIDTAAAEALLAIAVDARRLLASCVGGGTFDLVPHLVSVLVERHGLPREALRDLAAPVPAIPILRLFAEAPGPNLDGAAGGRLAKLFKSFDARRSDVLARVRTRLGELRELASAEVLDAEPRVYAGLHAAIEAQLTAALDRHVAWLADQLARTHADIARERETLIPMLRARDAAHGDARKLATLLAQP